MRHFTEKETQLLTAAGLTPADLSIAEARQDLPSAYFKAWAFITMDVIANIRPAVKASMRNCLKHLSGGVIGRGTPEWDLCINLDLQWAQEDRASLLDFIDRSLLREAACLRTHVLENNVTEALNMLEEARISLDMLEDKARNHPGGEVLPEWDAISPGVLRGNARAVPGGMLTANGALFTREEFRAFVENHRDADDLENEIDGVEGRPYPATDQAWITNWPQVLDWDDDWFEDFSKRLPDACSHVLWLPDDLED
jgi:hypothetical protein